MSVETHVDDALARVAAEQNHVADKLTAFEEFRGTVESIPPTRAGGAMGTTPATDGGLRVATRSGGTSDADRVRQVREAFDETIRPHSVDDLDEPESLLATIREEFGDDVTLALAPTTETRFTPDVKRAILEQTDRRRSEAGAMDRALDVEESSLRSAIEDLTAVVDWIATADETPLSSLGFDALRERHETLTAHRHRLEELATDRQETLQRTTNHGPGAGITHRELVRYLYGDFPMRFPVLWTVVRLDDLCTECQHSVRTHLVRRA